MDQRQQDTSRQAFGYLRSYGDSYTGFEIHDSTTGWAGLGQRENRGKALEVFFNVDGRQLSSVIFCNDPDAMADEVEAYISKHFGNKPTTESRLRESIYESNSFTDKYKHERLRYSEDYYWLAQRIKVENPTFTADDIVASMPTPGKHDNGVTREAAEYAELFYQKEQVNTTKFYPGFARRMHKPADWDEYSDARDPNDEYDFIEDNMINTSFRKMKSLYEVYNRLRGISLNEVGDYGRNSRRFLTELHMSAKDVPTEIQRWVSDKIGSVKRYEVIQKGSLRISPPWHEQTYNWYGTFKMSNGRFILLSEFGMSGNDPKDLTSGSHVIEIPSGHVVVETDMYTGTARIYTSDDALLAIPSGEVDSLTDAEKLALYLAKSYKPAARYKFKQEVYDSLIAKGLMGTNRSITINGRNALEQIPKDELRRAAEIFNKSNYANIYI